MKFYSLVPCICFVHCTIRFLSFCCIYTNSLGQIFNAMLAKPVVHLLLCNDKKLLKCLVTRMHSGGMCTVCCSSHLMVGGVSALAGVCPGGVCLGVSACGCICLGGRVSVQRGVCPGGVCPRRQWCLPRGVSAQRAHTPPVDRILYTVKGNVKITFLQLRNNGKKERRFNAWCFGS